MQALIALSSVLACAMAESDAGGYHGVAGMAPYAGVAGVAPYATVGAVHQAAATYGGVYNAVPAVAVAHAAPVAVAHAAPAVVAHAAPAVVAKAAPVAVAHAAPAVAAPVAHTTSSQYRAGDEFGNTAFGYTNPISSRQEQGNADGVVTGSYSYVDEAGTHTRSYIADAYGFRLTGESATTGRKRRSAPYPYAAQAVRDAELLTIKLNPGHATFYRVL